MRVWTAYACVDCLCVCVLCVPRVREYGLVREDQPHPEGNLAYVRMCIFTFFLRNTKLFASGRGSFIALSGCGGCRGPACTPRCKCGSRAGSVAHAPGVQSREIWQVTTGSLSAELEPTRPMETPLMPFACFLCCAAAYQCLLQVPHQPSGAVCFDTVAYATGAALQAFP